MRKLTVKWRLPSGKYHRLKIDPNAISDQMYNHIVHEGLKQVIEARLHKLPSKTLPWEAH